MKNSFKPFVFVIAHLGLPQQVWNSIDETWGKFQDRHYELWENEDGRRQLEVGVNPGFVVPKKTSPWEMVQFKALFDQEFEDTCFIEFAMRYCRIPIKEITWEALYCVWKENTDSFYTQVQEAMEADMTEKEKYWGPLPTVEYLGALYCVEIDPGSYSASLVTTPERHNVHEPTRSDVLDLFKQMYDVPKMMREARIEQAVIDAGGPEAYYHGGDPDVADEDLGLPDAGWIPQEIIVAAQAPTQGPKPPTVCWRYEDWRVRLPRHEWNTTRPFSTMNEFEIEAWMMAHPEIVSQHNVCDYWNYKELPF